MRVKCIVREEDHVVLETSEGTLRLTYEELGKAIAAQRYETLGQIVAIVLETLQQSSQELWEQIMRELPLETMH